MKFLLEEEIDELRKWFEGLYKNEGHTLEVKTWWDKDKKAEHYMINVFPHGRSPASLPSFIPSRYLDDLLTRKMLRDNALPRWKRAIMEYLR